MMRWCRINCNHLCWVMFVYLDSCSAKKKKKNKQNWEGRVQRSLRIISKWIYTRTNRKWQRIRSVNHQWNKINKASKDVITEISVPKGVQNCRMKNYSEWSGLKDFLGQGSRSLWEHFIWTKLETEHTKLDCKSSEKQQQISGRCVCISYCT